MPDYKIAIVNSSSFGKIFPDHLKRLKEIGEVKRFDVDQNIAGSELAELLKGFNIIISSVTPFFTKEFFDYKDELLLISRHGIGYNNIDIEAAKNHGTIVSIIPALVERDAVAENNITNLLAVLRRTTEANTKVREGRWTERASLVGRTLFNKKVGVIGVGNTGSCVVEILRNGFRCEVIAYDPYKSKRHINSFGAKKVEFDELLETSDIICLCANLTEENYHMISTNEIKKMKDQVYLSNSARGALVDEDAMVEALKSGKVAGYATDVLENEPGSSNHPYLAFENVVMTPHTAAYTMDCLEDMGEKCVQDVENIVKGILPVRSVQKQSNYIK
ncbi:D-isomer specific 2-hydroxyacid dehydrogenase family protein [Facklamia sp. 7083-14-GEN3]|uniref:D-isomer specific 2-hydroxyacid dehydrogenase family protein n=1 Tax=Facklamia sp. 7083-14-GEN3 TaxID=2973478 RepID=UPI00215C8855|nr:D-isomer specific 2-hydroxyacid dehydrogenase family protein [Facklamia sp. 7083-14-GEN3]MCR8969078.1 D-isomer specific 2-hydroxyacid dehydrogenase family protein [Facklamia sp. 7083-14-GEN3]